MIHWKVKLFDGTAQSFKDYDVGFCHQYEIKQWKKTCETKKEFAERIESRIKSQYWSRYQYEILISIRDNRVYLSPLFEHRHISDLDVTDDKNFDWRGFAEKHITKQGNKGYAKIDVYDQVMYRFDDFINYLWHTRFKWEKDNPKFHEDN